MKRVAIILLAGVLVGWTGQSFAAIDAVIGSGGSGSPPIYPSDPPNCSVATQYAQGIGTDGSAQCKQVQFSEIGGAITAGQMPTVGSAGACTSCNLSIDAQGRVTAYANGSGGGIAGSSPKIHADLASITVDAAVYNEVQVAELSQAAQLQAPTFSTGSGVEGQRITYSIFSTTSRPLTYVTSAGGFSNAAGILLPGKTIAGAYLTLEMRLSLKEGKWQLVSISDKRPDSVTGSDVASITIDCNAAELYSQAMNAQASYAFNTPVCTAFDGQMLRVRVTTTGTPKPISAWTGFSNGAGYALPTATTGSGIEDVFGFMRNESLSTWVMVASTQNPIANKRRRCILPLGDESSATVLTDAQIVLKKVCRVFGNATVEEIGVEATGAFQPAVSVQNLNNNTTASPLLAAPLQAAANGGYACARASAGVSPLSGITCNGNLQNTVIAAGDNTMGISSGTSNSSTNLTVTISFIEQ